LGEIYVIAVDPDVTGRGLGRDLTQAGLDHLADRGLTVGMLYVEDDNEAALGLYRQMGFHTHQEDIFFEGTVPAGSARRDGRL
jgi:mycothiol synthase